MPRPQVLTPRGRLFLTLGGLTVLIGTVLGYPDVTRVGALLLVLPLLVLLWLHRRTPTLRVERALNPPRLVPDQPGTIELTVTNTGRSSTPLYLAEEHLDYALGDRPRFLLPRLVPGERETLDYAVRSRHRGAYPLGPLTLRLRDPFGLTYLAVQLPETAELLVLPQVWPLAAAPPGGQGRGTEGELPQMVALHGEDDVSIRQWREGDELRRVHWPATAHRGELMVRQEDQPSRRRAVLLLDCRAGAYPGHGLHPSFEWAVSALASVARHLVADGYVVHLLTDDTVRDGTAGTPMELPALLERLARVQPHGQSGLEPLAAAAHTFTSGGVLLVAAVSAYGEGDLRDLAAVHDPGTTALAMVIDRDAWSPVREEQEEVAGSAVRGPGPRTGGSTWSRGLLRVLAETGWRTTLAGPHDTVRGAWEQLRGRMPAGSRS
ncbi:DUF58 domain-containing protein [Ornithinicoccus halotolerans]|uniref:DUF58 domain-containing protein n=1 Tax=Ornithinicoccus halotolerans TaxID=1748220 RepID=UPI001E58207A|nr:DUF58 domain-containing protein [Ornithinicoccus halotolerans]